MQVWKDKHGNVVGGLTYCWCMCQHCFDKIHGVCICISCPDNSGRGRTVTVA